MPDWKTSALALTLTSGKKINAPRADNHYHQKPSAPNYEDAARFRYRIKDAPSGIKIRFTDRREIRYGDRSFAERRFQRSGKFFFLVVFTVSSSYQSRSIPGRDPSCQKGRMGSMRAHSTALEASR